MESLIQKAIEGGYDFENMARDQKHPKVVFVRADWKIGLYKDEEVKAIYKDPKTGFEYGSWVIFRHLVNRKKFEYLLDPLFWQALGKACGWDKNPSWVTDNH